MRRIEHLFLGLACLLVSCTSVREPEGWAIPQTRQALQDLLQDKANRCGYAVFDCDNTSILHDVTHTLMLYQVENLRFAYAPEHLFLDGLKATDFPLEEIGVTAGEMGAALRDIYGELKSMQEEGVPMDSIRATTLFKDWRARFLAFYKAVGKSYDYGSLCLWEPSLTCGFSEEELHALGKESIDYWLFQEEVRNEEYESSDGKYCGKGERGLRVFPEMKALYKALEKAGIRPYICSASPEWLVEILACDPKIGFGISPDQVFGVRFVTGPDGAYVYDPCYPQPFKEGKVACIDSLIAPLHGGRQPVLVAGDSEGDIAMLTAYPDMKIGLIMNQYRGGEIEALTWRKDGRYFAQPVCVTEEHRLHRALEEMPSRAGSCYHSYEAAPGPDTPAPRGYKAVYISHYGRHGSRYHTAKMIERCYPREMLRVASLDMLTPAGKAVLERMMELYSAHQGHCGELAERGAREHRGIGRRMAARFPEVFGPKDSVFCVATHYIRCQNSMDAFLEGLGAANVSRRSGEEYFPLLSHRYEGQSEFFAEIRATQEQFRDRRIDPSRLQALLFKEGFVPDSLQQVLKSIFVYGCQEEDLEFPEEGRLFDVFTPGELFSQWTIYSDVVFGEMGNSVEYSHRILPAAKDLLKDVVVKADRALAQGDVAADLRFGHDNGLVPLVSLMGLEGFDTKYQMEGSWKQWPSFERIPMASNLQLVFYASREQDILVKLLYNEREASIPALKSFKGPYYRWTDLRAYLLSKV